jgi:hypothetical protein
VLLKIRHRRSFTKSLLVSVDHILEHLRSGDTRKVGATSGSCQGESETDQVESRITDDGLIEIADLDINMALRICDRSQITDVTVTTYPHCRATRYGLNVGSLDPFIEFLSAAALIQTASSLPIFLMALPAARWRILSIGAGC